MIMSWTGGGPRSEHTIFGIPANDEKSETPKKRCTESGSNPVFCGLKVYNERVQKLNAPQQHKDYLYVNYIALYRTKLLIMAADWVCR